MKYMGPKIKDSRSGIRVIAVVIWIILVGMILKGMMWLLTK